MNDAARMYEIQKVDLVWDKTRRRLLQIQDLLGETEALKNARQQAASTSAEMEEWRTKQKEAEHESRSLGERIQSTEANLMSGTVRNPKELESLQASLEALIRHRTAVDDSAVEALLHADELVDRLAGEQEAQEKLESEWSSGQKELLEEQAKLKQHDTLLKQRRETLIAEMGSELFNLYEHMRKRKNGVAISPVQQESCGTCHVRLPTGVISTLRNGTALAVCPSCGRYLHAP
jgi:uncharacterized protein